MTHRLPGLVNPRRAAFVIERFAGGTGKMPYFGSAGFDDGKVLHQDGHPGWYIGDPAYVDSAVYNMTDPWWTNRASVHSLTNYGSFAVSQPPALLLPMVTSRRGTSVPRRPGTLEGKQPGSRNLSAVTLESNWDRISRWLHRHAPATAALLNPPAPASAIDALADALGMRLPDDVVAMWRCVDGVRLDDGVRALIPPHYHLMSTAEALAHRRLLVRISDVDDADPEDIGEEAGSDSWSWLPVFLPIGADYAGETLFVDLRPGPLHGCVMSYDKVGACEGPPLWPTVASMFSQTADALDSGIFTGPR